MKTVISVAIVAALVAPFSFSSAAFAAKPKVYKNCAALNAKYKHGAGLKGAKDKHSASTKAVTNFTIISKSFYDANKKRDGDKDKILCEKR